MKILFIGQKGVPVPGSAGVEGDKLARERRIQALAVELADKGHNVAVTCASPFVSRNLTSFNGVELVHRFSLNPEVAGGWLHDGLVLLTMWRRQPDVVHVHSWRMAALMSLAVLLSPESNFVWTVDTLPEKRLWLMRLVARWAAKVCDSVTVTSRELQYMLLHYLDLRAEYIPDGYDETTVPEMSLGKLGLRDGKYVLTTAATARDIRFVAKGYKQAGGRKKLVVLQEARGPLKRLANEFKFLRFVGPQGGRTLRTLLRQAEVVMVAGDNASLEAVLWAMDGGRPIVSTMEGMYQETIGVSGQFVKSGDVSGLAEVLQLLLKSKQRQVVWGRKAQKRARNHFVWPRSVHEYAVLYHYPLLRVVAVDSVRPRLASKSA